MISKPSIVASIVTQPLPTALARPLLWGLAVLSLCASLARLTPPELTPRLLTRIWGPLPPYTLRVRGGDTCLRCGEAQEPVAPRVAVRLDAPLDIELRPGHPVAGPVFAHAFLRHAGHTTAWPILMEHAANGALLLSGTTRDLLDLPSSARGPYELLFIVQRSPLPPPAAAVQAQLTSADPQVLHHQVTLLAPTPPRARPQIPASPNPLIQAHPRGLGAEP